jgi:hypothetical protein
LVAKLVWNFGEISEVIEIVGETATINRHSRKKANPENINQRRFSKIPV